MELKLSNKCLAGSNIIFSGLQGKEVEQAIKSLRLLLISPHTEVEAGERSLVIRCLVKTGHGMTRSWNEQHIPVSIVPCEVP